MATIVQGGPSKARQPIIGVRRGTVGLKFFNIRNKGSDSVDGCAGLIVEEPKVSHRGPSRDIWPKNEKRGVTHPHDSPSGA